MAVIGSDNMKFELNCNPYAFASSGRVLGTQHCKNPNDIGLVAQRQLISHQSHQGDLILCCEPFLALEYTPDPLVLLEVCSVRLPMLIVFGTTSTTIIEKLLPVPLAGPLHRREQTVCCTQLFCFAAISRGLQLAPLLLQILV
jgi:hypothetical protein